MIIVWAIQYRQTPPSPSTRPLSPKNLALHRLDTVGEQRVTGRSPLRAPIETSEVSKVLETSEVSKFGATSRLVGLGLKPQAIYRCRSAASSGRSNDPAPFCKWMPGRSRKRPPMAALHTLAHHERVVPAGQTQGSAPTDTNDNPGRSDESRSEDFCPAWWRVGEIRGASI